ncbi:MAG: alpha/beta fold hydrolase [Cyclobacteriaceae bacterium]
MRATIECSAKVIGPSILVHDADLVAQWDQRGTGITNAWNEDGYPITLEHMHQDTKEVVAYLLKKFNREKLYLVRFSWGGFLGHQFAKDNPEQLHAYISVSSMISQGDSEQVTFDFLQAKALESNNNTAIEEINKINVPFESWEDLFYQRKWTAYFTSEKEGAKSYSKKVVAEWSEKWMPIFLEACKVNYMESAPELKCPVYFFVAKKDMVANQKITTDYFEKLIAPKKELIWFEQSNHEIAGEEPKKFNAELVKISSE